MGCTWHRVLSRFFFFFHHPTSHYQLFELVIWWSLDLHLPDHCIFWTACSLGYFGVLRASEFTIPNLSSFLPSLHLDVQDIAVDSPSAPSRVCIRIKGSNTYPFRKGCFIHIGIGWYPLCAVHALTLYLVLRGEALGPPFLFKIAFRVIFDRLASTDYGFS